MIVRIGFLLSLILNFVLVIYHLKSDSPKLPNVSKAIRALPVAEKAIENPTQEKLADLVVASVPEKKSIPRALSKEEFVLEEKIKAHFEYAKKDNDFPSQAALDWGKKLPEPQSNAEYALKFLLMQHFDYVNKPVEPGSFKANIYYDLPNYFSHLDDKFTSYMKDCLYKMDIKEDYEIRNQLYDIAFRSRDNFPFLKEVQDDYEYHSRYVQKTKDGNDMISYLNEKAKRYLASDQSETFYLFDTDSSHLDKKYSEYLAEQNKKNP